MRRVPGGRHPQASERAPRLDHRPRCRPAGPGRSAAGLRAPGRAAPPGRASGARPAPRARPPGPARFARRGPCPGPGRGRACPAAGIARTPFIVFVTALLGGGLICLLVINTILATGSYQITSLQQAQAARAQQVQVLKQQVAQESAPSVIAKRARQLGMVEPPLTKFLNLKSGRIIRQPATEPGVPAVPGYTP